MSTHIKINGTQHEAVIDGKVKDFAWDNRESKDITLEMSYSECASLFTDDVVWRIIQIHDEQRETAASVASRETWVAAMEAWLVDRVGNQPVEPQVVFETVTITDEYDNSEFSVLGDIIVHTDGTCTVCMGKPTGEETLLTLLYGG